MASWNNLNRNGTSYETRDESSSFRGASIFAAPPAIVSLADGRLAVCGWLDKEIRSYEISGEQTQPSVERAGTIATGCDSALAVIGNSIWFAGEAGVSEIKAP